MTIQIEKYGVQDYRILGWISDAVTDIYVRATAGNDGNSGSSSSQALQTLAAAYAKIPHVVNNTVRIHLGAHAGDGYAVPTFQDHFLNAHVIVIGDGAGEAGNGVTQLLSDSAIAGTDNIQVTITGPVVVDDYVGKTIRITSGNANGDRRTIKSNTATSIVATSHFSSPIGIGDTFVIEEPSISLDISTDTAVCSMPSKGINDFGFPGASNAFGLTFANFQLYPAGTGASLIVSGTMFLYGIECDTLNVVCDGLLCAGLDDGTGGDGPPVSQIGLLMGAISFFSWKGWGLSGAYSARTKKDGFVGYWVSEASGGMQIQQGSTLRIFGGRTRYITRVGNDGTPEEGKRTALSIYGEFSATYSRFLVSQPEPLATYPAIYLYRTTAKLTNIEIQDAADNEGIRVESDCWVELSDIIGTTAGIGVLTHRGGIVHWNGAQVLTGTIADFSEDNGTTLRAIAALIDEAYFVDATRQSRIFRSDL